MKQALINLLNNALHPFGLQVEPLRKPLIDPADIERSREVLNFHRLHHEMAQQERRLQMHLDALSSRPATLPPRRKRRGRPPIVERLTLAQVEMVRNKRLSTDRLAKKLGVSWPTANKLRNELA
jgi:response regulator of citrate/malate metabolism